MIFLASRNKQHHGERRTRKNISLLERKWSLMISANWIPGRDLVPVPMEPLQRNSIRNSLYNSHNKSIIFPREME